MSNRSERGLGVIRQFSGEPGVEAVEKLRPTSPQLADFITEFAFGDVYSVPGLTEREKICSTISSLVAQGEVEALQVHFHSAKHIGFTNEEIKGILLHCLPYAGFPKVIRAMQMLEKVLLNDEV